VVRAVALRDECLSKGRQFASNLHGILSQIEGLDPPPEAAPLQTRFLVAARTPVATVDDAVAELEAGTLECGAALNSRIYGLESTERAEAALDELSSLGYAPVAAE
jgi:hypothetical protein